ncbi:hypothetical protein M9H77_11756 [Catharanthus roseus]|uniref:Uncharacterized protein n=1 Tax=Catharanthus roseus TaxID=4058 RepID=A0ACC0BFH0_CATRO|nr:hypothetical protein M9H77_11756 [Catharanthus roseus]
MRTHACLVVDVEDNIESRAKYDDDEGDEMPFQYFDVANSSRMNIDIDSDLNGARWKTINTWWNVKWTLQYNFDENIECKFRDIITFTITLEKQIAFKVYKELVDAEKNPRTNYPYDFIWQHAWGSVCDRIESLEFKKRSLVNIENLKKLPYSHTSGSKSFHSHFAEML